jgi:hypothetical protein
MLSMKDETNPVSRTTLNYVLMSQGTAEMQGYSQSAVGCQVEFQCNTARS